MKARLLVGVSAGVVLLLGGLAHGFFGWPPLRSALVAAGVDPQVVGALAVGWYFGSAAMLAFGVVLLQSAWRVHRGNQTAADPARTVAITYVVFGAVAFVARDFNPHFLFFVLTGLLVGVFAFWPGSANRTR